MSLIKARAKINNIVSRVLPYGKKDLLQLVDRTSHEILADVKLWSWRELNTLQQDGAEFELRVTQDNETKDLLGNCLIALNGNVHDVIRRNAPKSVSGIEWFLRTKSTNELV